MDSIDQTRPRTLRDRTPEDPPVVDYGELTKRLQNLAFLCSCLHDDTRYLPHLSRLDEAYKAHRTLMTLEDVDRAIATAEQLSALVREIVISAEEVVKAPEDLEWEAEKARKGS